jgi:NhaA family Na+:H+ antiporter
MLLSALLALFWANSDHAAAYEAFTHATIGMTLGDLALQTSLLHVVNDGLMVVFFLLLGLEIKREILAGDLVHRKHRRMLIACAAGGVIGPAILYLLFNATLDSRVGWGIPIATDTAIALGVLALVRKHVPASLMAFLVGLAIVDDIVAILVIAVFYTQELSLGYLAWAFCFIALLAVGNYGGVRHNVFYIAGGIAAWWMMLQSGVHPTLAGVAIAFTVPARPKEAAGGLLVRAKTLIESIESKDRPIDVLGQRDDHDHVTGISAIARHAGTPLRRWEDLLELPVSLFILPLFVLLNAGVPFSVGSVLDGLKHPVGSGVITGLVLGKLVGISCACWLALRIRLGSLPDDLHFHHVVGVSLIAGIGFTMSTFIATLGFGDVPAYLLMAKSSILAASLLSAVLGVVYLRAVAAMNLP